MSKSITKEAFQRDHPFPATEGLASLYKFSKIDMSKQEHLRDLFIDAKLYLALPEQFNDPFECKPLFSWPPNPKKIRVHLFKVARADKGRSKFTVKKIVNDLMIQRDGPLGIASTIKKILSKLRICCFTQKLDNLLFWAHYADSHKGFCLEYDATLLPVSLAFKVKYQDSYPTVEYPMPRDQRAFQPVLIKSLDWEKELEYRIVLQSGPSAMKEHNLVSSDSKFLSLPNNVIKKIYFGANVDPAHKESIKKLIKQGPFNPTIWQATLSESTFELKFYPEPP
jgi:hypothetical protein